MATNDIIAFLDDDVRCPETWLAALIESYDENPESVAIGGPAISIDEQGNVLNSLIKSNNTQNQIWPDGYLVDHSDRWVPAKPVEVDHLLGANMSFRTAALDRVGGFDPEYKGTAFREESAVFARFWHQNGQVMYCPDARVDHVVKHESRDNSSMGKQSPRGAYWRGRNQVRLLAQEFPEEFPLNLSTYLLKPPNRPAPFWKRAVGVVLQRPRQTFWLYRGIFDGLRYERRISAQGE